MRQGSQLPIVAIVGRPNVGKSTLFNRYAGSRRALVEDRPGITRDRVVEEVEVGGRSLLLVDTAGLEPKRGEGLEGAVQDQARAALEEADAILFVVDGQQGRLPVDEELARMLHRATKPVALVVNKVDAPKHEDRVNDFLSLGFERCHAVSAEHNRSVWEALEDLAETLPPEPADAGHEAEEEGVRIALVGRPNVGKSSLLNALAGEERVVVSDVPGTTRDAIDTRVEHDGRVYTLVDTAGLRRPGRRTRTAERGSALMTVRSVERADVALVVIDASQGPTDQDARVASLARERGCACVVLANKWDLVSGRGPEAASGRETLDDDIRHALRFMKDAPVLHVSAVSGAGLRRIFPAVEAVAAAGRRRVPTAELNRWLEETVARHEPAMAQRGHRRKPVKFQYATQVGVRPPTFVLFCTDPRAVQPSYRRFLENRLRQRFDLRGTPVRLSLRARARD
ncbi:MAG: ribosome biogenesis GTPase Der [Myxococcota bacterium]|nr:ribosome biogenesis GTPase Der [Myxococcota bacterium]